MIVPGGNSPGQEGNDGALLLTSRNKGGERNDRLRNVVSRHYDHHACICRIELLQGRSIGTSRHPARTVWRLPIQTEGRSSTAASSLPALLLYHLHEAPSSPFAANNAFVRRIGLPQGRSIGTSRHPARTVWRLQSHNGGEKLSAASSLPALYSTTPARPRQAPASVHSLSIDIFLSFRIIIISGHARRGERRSGPGPPRGGIARRVYRQKEESFYDGR